MTTPIRSVKNLSELIVHIKELHKQLVQTEDRREQVMIELGRELAEAKHMKPKNETWPNFVRLHFNFSQQRADELIQIGEGKTTVEETRQKTRDRMKKSRAKKSLSRDSESEKIVQLFDSHKKKKSTDSKSDNVNQQVTKLYMELKEFTNDYCARLTKWNDAHTDLDNECRIGLIEVLEDSAMSLQRLAQVIDGR